MTLRNEIFEGLGAATAAQKLVYDPRDDYYEQLAKHAKTINDQDDELKKNREAAKAAGIPPSVPTVPVPTVASTATPGAPAVPAIPRQPPAPTVVAASNDGVAIPGMRRGGRVALRTNAPQFAGGGSVDARGNRTPTPIERRRDWREGMDDEEPRGVIAPSEPIQWYERANPTTPNTSFTTREDFGQTPEIQQRWRDSPHPHGIAYRQGGSVQRFERGGPADRGYSDEPDDPQPLPLAPGLRTPPYAPQVALVTEVPSPNRDDPSDPATVEVDPSHPDVITKQMLALQGGSAADKINRTVGEPWGVTGPGLDWEIEGDKYRTDQEAKGRQQDAREAESLRTSAPEAKPTSQVGRVLTSINDFVNPTGSRGEYDRNQVELARQRELNNTSIFAPSDPRELRQRKEKSDELQRERVDRTTDKIEIPKYDIPTEPPSLPPAIQTKIDDYIKWRDDQIDKATGERPTGPTGTASSPAPPPGSASAQSPSTAPKALNAAPPWLRDATSIPPEGLTQPPPVGAGSGVGPGEKQAAGASQPQPPPPPPVAGPARVAPNSVPPGGGPTVVASRAPPPPATTAPPPPPTTTAPPPPPTVAPPPPTTQAPPAPPTQAQPAPPTGAPPRAVQTGAPPVPPAPPGSMSDPNRTAAYDPTKDYIDPTRRRTNEELAQVLVGAGSQAQARPNGAPPPVGAGAVSRPVGQAYVNRYSNNGQFEPGEAILRGMLSDYKTLLAQGRVEMANKMAYGLIQYANLEAASHAHVAADMVKQGNFAGALRNVAEAATYLPDGMTHRVGADGRSMETVDPRTGQVTATTPVDGRWLLAAIGGFTSGDLMWQTLGAAAATLKGSPDKGAEGRELNNAIRRNTLLLQDQRLRRSAGIGGGKGTAPMSEAERQATEIRNRWTGRGSPSAPNGGGGSTRAQGSDDSGGDEIQPRDDE
jgi:hypothetical protein